MTVILIRVKTAVSLKPLTLRTNLKHEKTHPSANQEAALLVTFSTFLFSLSCLFAY